MCQRYLPKTARKGTRFCGTNCRSRAYRLRRHHQEASSGGPLGARPAPPGRPQTPPTRRRAGSPLTIPAVLAHMQQARERVGLPRLLTDPMLAYQANLDALLTERMGSRRILVSHATDAEQTARATAAWLNDPSVTQVGIGVAPTERGDSVVVILLGKQVAGAVVAGAHIPTAQAPPIVTWPRPKTAPSPSDKDKSKI